MEFTDRYQALGIPYPEVETMCQDQCEGTGWIPVSGHVHRKRGSVFTAVESDPELAELWQAAHLVTCSWLGRVRNFVHGLVTFDRFRLRLALERCDGYHFVKCPSCAGTGKRIAVATDASISKG